MNPSTGNGKWVPIVIYQVEDTSIGKCIPLIYPVADASIGKYWYPTCISCRTHKKIFAGC